MFCEEEDNTNNKMLGKYTVVVIYDISDNKRRLKLSKILKGYGYRVQKSAFECIIDNRTFKRLVKEVDLLVKREDLVRIYKLHSNVDIQTWGDLGLIEDEDFIFI